jgi:hypothetical protein
MTDGVFQAPTPETPTDDPQIDPVVAAKRLADKDAYIAQLEAEAAERVEAMRQLEADIEARRILVEAQQKAANPPTPREAPPAAQEPAKPLSEDELVERVLEAQRKRTAEANAANNLNIVNEHMIGVYGTVAAAQKAVADIAADLGVDTDFLMDAARRSPDAFYKIARIEGAKQAPAPRSDVNTVALKTNTPGVKPGTPEYWDSVRDSMPASQFYTPKVQQQRMKELMAYHAAQR